MEIRIRKNRFKFDKACQWMIGLAALLTILSGWVLYFRAEYQRILQARDSQYWFLWCFSSFYFLGASLIMMGVLLTLRKLNSRLKVREVQDRVVLRALPEDYICLLSKEGEVISLLSSERPPKGLLEKVIKEILPWIAPGMLNHLWKALSTGNTLFFEQSLEVDGERRFFEVRLAAYYQEIMAIIRDISQHKKMEEDLLTGERRFRTIFEGAPIGITISDPSGRLIESNQAFQKMLGYTEDELREKNIREVTHPDDVATSDVFLQRLLEGRTGGFQLEKRFICKDGRVVWTNATVFMTQNRDGKSQFAIGMVNDITSRKQVEEALSTEKERLSVTLQSIGDAVIATDTKGNVLFVNSVAETMLGFSKEEAVGRPLSRLLYLIDDLTSEPFADPVEKVLLQKERVNFSGHPVLVNRDGREISVEVNGSPLRDDKEILGVVLVLHDITEKKMWEEEMLKSKKLESLGILAGGIAHDFNNMLAGLLAHLQLAKVLLERGEEIYNHFGEMEAAIMRAVSLTKQLLTFSKGGAPVKKPATISELIVDTVDFSMRGSKVKCEFSVPSFLWSVEIDEGQISQVINNLILNAIQAMPNGGIIKLKVQNTEIRPEDSLPLKPGKYVKISVKDTGEGIEEEHLPMIFDPFFTTKPAGNGLGLATSYAIMRKHDGYIQAKSEPGGGAAFSLYLPASEVVKVEKTDPSLIRIQGRGRVLLMDDEEYVRVNIKALLESVGYEVATAINGEEVVDIYDEAFKNKAPFDVVIMDLTVPGSMGGREALQKLLEINSGVKAVVSSGYSNNPIMSGFKDYGFSGVVSKPYTIQELHRILQELISSAPLVIA